jgi:hypothetical protein
MCSLGECLEVSFKHRLLIVPTLGVGMQPGTLRVPLSKAERGASVEAFPRGAWERSLALSIAILAR